MASPPKKAKKTSSETQSEHVKRAILEGDQRRAREEREAEAARAEAGWIVLGSYAKRKRQHD